MELGSSRTPVLLVLLGGLVLLSGCLGGQIEELSPFGDSDEGQSESENGTQADLEQSPAPEPPAEGGEDEVDTPTAKTNARVDFSQPSGQTANLTSALAQTGVDPTEDGSLAIERSEYDFGYTIVTESNDGPAYKAKLAGSVTYPIAEDQASDGHPVVAFMHGRHGTCEVLTGARLLGTPECPDVPPAMQSVPSYQGYQYIADTLATHGLVVISIDANDINDRDATGFGVSLGEEGGYHRFGDAGTQPRAQLILRTLDAFEQIDGGEDPGAPVTDNGDLVDALKGRLDLDGVGLVGHSRGGDGVSYTVAYNEDRMEGQSHELAAVFSIAPTDFVASSAPGVAYATLLPYCDGDVFNLWGAHIYDRTRYLEEAGPLYQYVAMGANHNFYNTVWTGYFDDAGGYTDPFCGEARDEDGGRLSPEDQRRHGEALINAFLRVHLTDEQRFEPWLQGRTLTPPAACPLDQWPCIGLIHTSYHPPAADRLVVEAVDDAQALEENDLGGEVHLEGKVDASVCTPPDCPTSADRQLASQITLEWTGPGRYGLQLPSQKADLSEFGWLSVRAGANFGTEANANFTSQDISIAVLDEEGNQQRLSAAQYGHALYVPPGEDEDGRASADVTLSAIRIPLAGFDEVDTSQVSEIAILTDRTDSGSIQLADVMLQR